MNWINLAINYQQNYWQNRNKMKVVTHSFGSDSAERGADAVGKKKVEGQEESDRVRGGENGGQQR